MANRLTYSLLGGAFALLPFHAYSAWQRSRSEQRPLAAWAAATHIPSLALLPSSGAIVEANSSARELFPDIPLLESDLASLFPDAARTLRATLAQMERDSSISLPVTRGDRAFTLMLSSAQPDATLLAAVVLPRIEPEPAPSPIEVPPFPPLVLPNWQALPFEAQLQALLAAAVEQWPLRDAALFRRLRMGLEPVAASSDMTLWSSLQLSAVELGSLLHDGAPLRTRLKGQPLLLLPLRLAPGTPIWGALALRPKPHVDDTDPLRNAAHQLAWMAETLLSRAQWRSASQAHAERATQAEALRNHVLDSLRRGVLLINRDGHIEFLNEAASKLLGWLPDDVLGRPLGSLLDDLGPLGAAIALALSAPPSHGPPPATTARLHRLGQRTREVSLRVEPVNDRVGSVLIFLEDEEGILAFGEVQHHLDRMAILGKMSAMVAHDLRNPLASILYGIETLAERLDPDHAEHGTIRLLLAEGERVHRIIEDVLSISRQPSLTINLCSLRVLMEQVADAHQRQLRHKQIHVRRYYDPALPLIEGDSVRLGQMLDNLFNNAIEALAESGQIEIVMRPLELEQSIARGLSPDQEGRLQGGAEILIRDNGPGIPEEQHERIFEPLFTTKSNGTGLGLPIARTIVEQHRGHIFLDSAPGKGTTFQIFLPQLSTPYRNDE